MLRTTAEFVGAEVTVPEVAETAPIKVGDM
jgi:hypothetical protein